MKLLWISLGIASLVTFAAFLIPAPKEGRPSLDPALVQSNQAALAQLNLRKQEEHPVTAEQQAAADEIHDKIAPDFTLPGEDGSSYSLGSLTKEKALMIFFVEKNCPCCLGAKYFVDRMQELYKDHLTTVAIINADRAEAGKWKQATMAEFPILLDPGLEVIKKYQATRGVYTTLVAPGGRIAAAYPGYGKQMLKDLGAEIAKLAGIEPRPYEAMAAPDELTSGCSFPEPEK